LTPSSTRTTGKSCRSISGRWCFFALGCIVGSFLNVCIYRMPLDLSVVSPPSHCPHCKYAIPFYLNIPLVTWLALRGRCKNCGAPISPRYFIVELLTGLTFLSCWLVFGRQSSVAMAVVYAIFLAGTDLRHVH
jgi:leader peptidase (prepilin peptidase)/N-methyltransferase